MGSVISLSVILAYRYVIDYQYVGICVTKIDRKKNFRQTFYVKKKKKIPLKTFTTIFYNMLNI